MRRCKGVTKRLIALGLVAVLLATAFGLSACGGGDGGDRSEPASGIVKAFFEAGNAGRYSEARSYLTPETVNLYDSSDAPFSLFGSLSEEMDKATKYRTLTEVKIINEVTGSVDGWVELRLYFQDGSSFKTQVSVSNEGGGWKISSPIPIPPDVGPPPEDYDEDD